LVLGFGLGAATFGLAQHLIRHRNHSKDDELVRKRKQEKSDGKLSIIGTVLDSVPETLFVGIIAFLRQPGLYAAVVVLFLGNLATTLEGAKIMHNQGMGKKEILRGWLADFAIVALAAPIGYFLAGAVINDVLAVVLSFAAGTLIVFIAGELIARAYRESTGHNEDLFISAGFLIGVILLFVL
jgi:zinc transporter ZupT